MDLDDFLRRSWKRAKRAFYVSALVEAFGHAAIFSDLISGFFRTSNSIAAALVSIVVAGIVGHKVGADLGQPSPSPADGCFHFRRSDIDDPMAFAYAIRTIASELPPGQKINVASDDPDVRAWAVLHGRLYGQIHSEDGSNIINLVPPVGIEERERLERIFDRTDFDHLRDLYESSWPIEPRELISPEFTPAPSLFKEPDRRFSRVGAVVAAFGALRYGDGVFPGIAAAAVVNHYGAPRAYQLVMNRTGSEVAANLAIMSVGLAGCVVGGATAFVASSFMPTDFISGPLVNLTQVLAPHPLALFIMTYAGIAAFDNAGQDGAFGRAKAMLKRSRKMKIGVALALVAAFGIIKFAEKKPDPQSASTSKAGQAELFKAAPNNSGTGTIYGSTTQFTPYAAATCTDTAVSENLPSAEEKPRIFGSLLKGFPIRVIGKQGNYAQIAFDNNGQDTKAWIKSDQLCAAKPATPEGPK